MNGFFRANQLSKTFQTDSVASVAKHLGDQSVTQPKVSIICSAPTAEKYWRWHADFSPFNQLAWHFVYYPSLGIIDRYFKRISLAKVIAGFQTARLAKQIKPNFIASHEAELTFWCAFFIQLFKLSIDHVAFAFNYPLQPTPLRRFLMTWALKSVSSFRVSSTMEKQLYHQYFKIPLERIEVSLWKMGVSNYSPNYSLESEDYICAIGCFGRDYVTLIAAMEQLPDLRLVLVARPKNVEGLKFPPNVKVLLNIEGVHAMNVLQFSRFMVLPLADSEMPCGHITLVSAMHLGKAMITTYSTGISDYVRDGYNSLVCEAANPTALAATIRQLWNSPDQCHQLGENGRRFAAENCSESLDIQQLEELFRNKRLLPELE